MIQVLFTSNTSPVVEIFPADTKVSQILSYFNISPSGRDIFIDGSRRDKAVLDMTLEQLGITTQCFIGALEGKNNA